MATIWTVCAVAGWQLLSALIDRRNARREDVPAVRFREIIVVFAIALAGVLLAPAQERLAVGLALAGIGTAACGDLRHGYLWEEISIPTLFAVLGASALSGTEQNAIAGTAVMGGVALLLYFGGELSHKEPGFGDVVPTAIIGAAVGPFPALGAFAIVCAAFAIGALAFKKRLGVALPFGPAIAAALLIAAAGWSLPLSGLWR